MKRFFEILVSDLIRPYTRAQKDLGKVEVLKGYAQFVGWIRSAFWAGVFVLCIMFICLLGLALFVVGAFMSLPEGLISPSLGLMAVGVIQALLAFLLVRRLYSEELWIRFFRIDQLINEVAKPQSTLSSTSQGDSP